MKKLWIGLMALVLFLALAGMAAAEQEITLSTPTWTGVYDSEGAAVFQFEPTESGLYEFHAVGDAGQPQCSAGYVMDADRNLLAEADSNYYSDGFSVCFPLTAGGTYYLAAMYSHNYGWIDNEESFMVQLDKKTDFLVARALDEVVYSCYNQPGTVAVEARSLYGSLTYQWYDGATEITGATKASYTYPALTAPKTYRCVVTDGENNTAEVTVEARVDTETSIEADEEEIDVAYGGSADLSVTVNAVYKPEDLTCQWFRVGMTADGWTEEELVGETGTTLHLTNITRSSRYQCTVIDTYGNEGNYAEIYVTVPGEVSASAEEQQFDVEAGGSVTMSVTATTPEECGPLTYEWREIGTAYEHIIEGATGPELTVNNLYGFNYYGCTVTNNRGNTRYLSFYISAGRAWEINEPEEDQIRLGDEGTATLTVSTTGNEALTYQWYYWDRSVSRYTAVQGATGTSLQVSKTGYYYCRVKDSHGISDSCLFEVTADGELSVEADSETELSLAQGASTTLKVKATGTGLKYRWYKADWIGGNHGYASRSMVEGAQSDTLEITCDGRCLYCCVVSDALGNMESINFHVAVDSGFTAVCSQTQFTVEAGKPVTMSVNAQCTGGMLHYHWKHRDEKNYHIRTLPDAAGNTLTIEHAGADNWGYYFLTVSDDYGNSESFDFRVEVENHFSAKAAVDTEQWLNPGETTQLAVTVTCDDMSTVSYQWYKKTLYEDGDYSYWTNRAIAGATGATYTTDPADECHQYYCNAQDVYGHWQTIYFYIYIDNELEAEAAGNETEINVEPGSTAELAVVASCKTGSLTYQWYEDGQYSDRLIAGATGATYTTGAINGTKRYICKVKDQYRNSKSISFSVSIENELAVVPVGTKSRRVAPGAGLTLAVAATCKQGQLTYEWYKAEPYRNKDGDEWLEFDNSDPIDGEDSDSCEIDSVTYHTAYRCEVTDEYGGSETVEFIIYVENHLTIASVDWAGGIPYGGQATIDVTASCDTGELHYWWYKHDGERELLSGETGSSLTTEALYKKENTYSCRIRDDYGNETNNYMYLYPDTGLTAEADGESVFHYTGEPITLAAEAENVFGDTDFNYRWYDPDNNIIANGSESSVTLTEPTAGEYQCDVSDGQACVTVSFYVFRDEAAAYGVGSGREYLPGETATMRVIAWNAENDITYQWYDTDQYDEETGTYQLIEGATGAEYSFEVNHNREVGCYVRGTGLEKNIYFSARVKNTLSIDTAGLSSINVIPAGGSLEMTINVTCGLDSDPAIQWYRNGQAIPGGTDSTLTVTEAGTYRIKAEDPYGNSKEEEIYCVAGQAATLAEGQTAEGPETGTDIWPFIPAKTGTYLMQNEGWPAIYLAGKWGPEWCVNGTLTAGLEAGKTYYVRLSNEYESFRYTLLEEEQDEAREYTIILQKGMRLEFPWNISKISGYTSFDHAASSKPSVIRVSEDEMTLRNEGTADVTATYQDGSQVIYHITVTSGNTLALPEDLETIEADAFNGDGNVKFIKIGRNVRRIERGAFANMGTVCVMIENDWSNIEYGDGVFTNTQPVFICSDYGYAAGYCNEHGIPHLELQE